MKLTFYRGLNKMLKKSIKGNKNPSVLPTDHPMSPEERRKFHINRRVNANDAPDAYEEANERYIKLGKTYMDSKRTGE